MAIDFPTSIGESVVMDKPFNARRNALKLGAYEQLWVLMNGTIDIAIYKNYTGYPENNHYELSRPLKVVEKDGNVRLIYTIYEDWLKSSYYDYINDIFCVLGEV